MAKTSENLSNNYFCTHNHTDGSFTIGELEGDQRYMWFTVHEMLALHAFLTQQLDDYFDHD